MSRKVGVSAIQARAKNKEDFNKAGQQLALQRMSQWTTQLSSFKTNLQEFAIKYKTQIRKDAVFRGHFQSMCQSIGVDPLASHKGFWADLLGIGEYYYELGIHIAEISMATRDRNGGLLPLNELLDILGKMKKDVSEDDVTRSIKALSVLGNGYQIMQIGNLKILNSNPQEMNSDSCFVLEIAQGSGYVSTLELQSKLNWSQERAQKVLDDLIKEGICWIDQQSIPYPTYWISALFQFNS